MTGHKEDPVAEASTTLFHRYLTIIDKQADDPLESHPRLSLGNLRWMCTQGIQDAHNLPLDKISRWLGFIQGCLAMRNLADVDEERTVSRPILHDAYRKKGILPPDTRENT